MPGSQQAPVLMLWSSPRSRSTAFFRMMAERGDFTAVHEPFSSGGFGDVPSRDDIDIEQHPVLSSYLAHHLPLFEKLYAGRLTI
jgi:hypothetical protein